MSRKESDAIVIKPFEVLESEMLVNLPFARIQKEICRIPSRIMLGQKSSVPAVLADTTLSKSITSTNQHIEKQRKALAKKLLQLLKSPSSDRVWQVLEKMSRISNFNGERKNRNAP